MALLELTVDSRVPNPHPPKCKTRVNPTFEYVLMRRGKFRGKLVKGRLWRYGFPARECALR